MGALCITVQLEDLRGHPWDHRGTTVGPQRGGPEDPGEWPWGHHGSPRGHRWDLDPLAGTTLAMEDPRRRPWEQLESTLDPSGELEDLKGSARAYIGSTVGAPWIPRGEPGDLKGRP